MKPLGPAARGPDGLWRRLVEVDGGPCSQVVPSPLSNEVLLSAAERAALEDLARRR